MQVEEEVKKEGMLTNNLEIGASEERSRAAGRSRRPDARSKSKGIKADGVEEIRRRLDIVT